MENNIKPESQNTKMAVAGLTAAYDCFTALQTFAPAVANIAKICTDAIARGNKVMFCGNGGSASQSQHLAAELVGRFMLNRPAMASIALTVDTSVLTAVGNDYGFDTVFARQVQGLGRSGDVLIGLSTSGNSENVIRAFQMASTMGIKTIAFTGAKPSRMAEIADDTIAVPSTVSANIQEMHLCIGHIICGIIEHDIYGGIK